MDAAAAAAAADSRLVADIARRLFGAITQMLSTGEMYCCFNPFGLRVRQSRFRKARGNPFDILTPIGLSAKMTAPKASSISRRQRSRNKALSAVRVMLRVLL